MSQKSTAAGGCLCGGVQYEVRGALRSVIACHCSQCAKTSGNFVAATSAATSEFALITAETLSWYRSSDTAQRGFCRRCGGNLFWQEDGANEISITAGTLEAPTGLKTAKHIFVGSKSDFYDICDGAEQKENW